MIGNFRIFTYVFHIFRQEVMERRGKERNEHEAYVNEAYEKQLAESNEEAREETSRQLNQGLTLQEIYWYFDDQKGVTVKFSCLSRGVKQCREFF